MTNPNGKATDALVRKNVDRYEAMLMSGRKEYFDEDDLLDVADYYYNDMSRKESALQCLDYALSLHPGCMMATLMKAEIIFFAGKREEAWALINSVGDKTDQDVLYYKGLFCLEEGRLAEAGELYRKAYFAQMGDGTDLFCQIISDYLEHNIVDGLDKWFAMLPDTLRKDKGVLETEADYLRIAGKYKEAVAVEEKLIDADPYNSVYWNGIARLYYMDDNFSKAHESVMYALDIEPENTESLEIAANVATHYGEFDVAADYYNKYISIDDKNGLIYYNYAQALVYAERYAEALVMLDYALKYADERQFGKSDVYLMFSTVYWALGDTKDARTYLEKTERKNMTDEAYMMRRLSIDLKENKIRTIKADVREVTDLVVKQQSDPWSLLYILTSFGNYDLMQYVIDRIERENPKYAAECSPFRAMVEFMKKDTVGFLENLKEAVSKAPEETMSLFSGMFPEGLDVKDYYAYALRNSGI